METSLWCFVEDEIQSGWIQSKELLNNNWPVFQSINQPVNNHFALALPTKVAYLIPTLTFQEKAYNWT